MLDNSGATPSKQHNNTICQSIIKRIIWLIPEEEGGEVIYQTRGRVSHQTLRSGLKKRGAAEFF